MGDTWIAPKGIRYELKENVALYKGASFLSEKEMYGLMPQTVMLLEDRSDGWKRIKTAYGDRWIVPDGVPYQITKPTQLFTTYSFNKAVDSITSEKVVVTGEQPGGWYQIKSSKGTHWIAPNGIQNRAKEDIKYKSSEDLFSPILGTIPTGSLVTQVGNDRVLWNGQNVYVFYVSISLEPIKETSYFYVQQPYIYASLSQIKNVVTNGHDDAIDEQVWNDFKKWLSEPPKQNRFDFTINFDSAEFDKTMGEANKEIEQANKHLKSSNATFDKVFIEINDALRLANEGMQQMNQGVNQTNSAMKGMIEGINQANKGMQQMIEGINQANEGLQEANNAIVQSNAAMQQMNTGIQQMLNAINKMQQGLDKATNSIDVSIQNFNSIMDAPPKALQSDLKTIHLDFDFSNIVPTSSPEEKLRQQQRDEAMYNLLAFMPFTGNFVSLAELISGKNLNSDADFQASDYALNMLAVLGGGEIKAGAAFLGSISKVTKRQKFTNTKIDLSWLDKFGDKYAAHEVTGTVKVAGQTKDISRRVYRMKNIDWDYVAPPSVNKSGKSNLQLALDGGVPFTKDNHKIELHHLTQKEPGAMVEIPANKHDEFTKALHGLVESGESFRNDKELYKQYNNFRNNYWKMRVQEHLEGK
ncbi:HNH/ENDO VII family nuclease [Bacillus mycoides]